MRYGTPLFVMFSLANCSSPRQLAEQDWTPVPSADLGAVVARVGRVPIFANQVAAEAKKTGRAVRAALDDLIASNLLAEYARQEGYALVGSTDADVESALVQRLLEKEVEPNLRPEAIPDSALRPLYDRVRDTFVHARLVEVGLLAVYTGRPMRREDREPREQTARELALFLKNHPAQTLEDFAAIAGDPAWSGRKVVFTRMLQGPDKPLSKAVGFEVAKLRRPGDTTPLVTDEDGSFIARYIDERPPENITFEQARDKLLAGFYEHWRSQQFLEFTTRLAQLHRVETHFDRLTTNEQGL